MIAAARRGHNPSRFGSGQTALGPIATSGDEGPFSVWGASYFRARLRRRSRDTLPTTR
jgi:hypothetical protein